MKSVKELNDEWLAILPLFTCKFCGAPSWVEPSDQDPPPDYCHESDHGEQPLETAFDEDEELHFDALNGEEFDY